MRFASLFSAVTIAALAFAPSALAGKVDITTRVNDGLHGIEDGVIELQQAYLAFTRNGTVAAQAGQMAMESAAKLGAALNETTTTLLQQNSYIKKSQAHEVVSVYRYIAGNITVVTVALRAGQEAITKAGVLQVVDVFLTSFETQLDNLGAALKKKIPKGHGALHAIKKYWEKIDFELETTLKTYGIVDASCDNNPIARRDVSGGARRSSYAGLH